MATQVTQNFERIKQQVRRLTASPSEASLSNEELEREIQTFMQVDFLAAVKTDISRRVFRFYTSPNVDRYPLDVSKHQSVRSAAYVEGYQASLYKDREPFYRIYPRLPSKHTPATGDGAQTGFTFTLSKNIAPLTVTIGTKDDNDIPMKFADDGGRRTTQGSIIPVDADNSGNISPAMPDTSPVPDSSPANAVGTVAYDTGEFNLDLNTAPGNGKDITVWIAITEPSRPRSILFWRNEFVLRPMPDDVYRIEVETYVRPDQFLNDESVPELPQWSEYIALGSAIKILRNRQDMEGVQNLLPFFESQEGKVLNRQASEEIGVRNETVYTDPIGDYPYGYPWDGVF